MEETVVDFIPTATEQKRNSGRKKEKTKICVIIIIALVCVLSIMGILGFVFRANIMRAVLGDSKYYIMQELKIFSSVAATNFEHLKLINPKISSKTDITFNVKLPSSEESLNNSFKAFSDKTKIQVNYDNDTEAKKSKIIVDLKNDKSPLTLRCDLTEKALGVSFPKLLEGQYVLPITQTPPTNCKTVTGFSKEELTPIVKDFFERIILANITEEMISSQEILIENQKINKVTFSFDGKALTKIYKAVLAEANGNTNLNAIVKSISKQMELAHMTTSKMVPFVTDYGEDWRMEKIPIKMENVMKRISEECNAVSELEDAFTNLDGNFEYRVYYSKNGNILNRDVLFKTKDKTDYFADKININSNKEGFWIKYNLDIIDASKFKRNVSLNAEFYNRDNGKSDMKVQLKNQASFSQNYFDLICNDISTCKIGDVNVLSASGSVNLAFSGYGKNDYIDLAADFKMYPNSENTKLNTDIDVVNLNSIKMKVNAVSTLTNTPDISDVNVSEKSTLDFANTKNQLKLSAAMTKIMVSNRLIDESGRSIAMYFR